MSAVEFKSSDPFINPILKATFPRYGKPTVTVRPFTGPVNVNSYWDGGSRSEFHFYSLIDGCRTVMPSSHPFFDRKQDGERCGNLEIIELPRGILLVQGGTFCGKTAHITIYANPEDINPHIAAPKVELSADEASALRIISSTRSGYRREAFARAGLGDYDASNPAVVCLKHRGLLKVNGAGAVSITVEGRNAIR